MKRILIIGSGGLAREFTSYFTDYSDLIDIVGFSTNNYCEHTKFNLPGILFEREISPKIVGTSEVVIAIGNPSKKRKISDELRILGFTFPSIIHPTSVVSKQAIIDEGVVVSPSCVISPNVHLKAFSYLNFCCGVGHDTVVGRYVQVNPGSQLGGFSVIGDGTLVGSGSTILERVIVGENSTIASGSVVFSGVVDGATMMGNPAKRMRAFEK